MMRTVLLLSLASTAGVALWWLEQMPPISGGGSPASLSTDALQALCAIQIFAVVLLGPRLGATFGHRAGVALACGIAIAWPLAVLIGSATPLTGWRIAGDELAIAALALVLPAGGRALCRLAAYVRNDALDARALVSLGSVTAAAVLWWSQARWLGWLA